MSPPAETLPVFTATTVDATTYREFPATIQGTQDIEIRPQVNGYLNKIAVDEGTYVNKGQLLFKIDDHIYLEQLNTAKAALATAKAELVNAELEVSKLAPLVKSNVISEMQLQTAQAEHDAAAARVKQAEAMVSSAAINLGYTNVKAPVDGYIGRTPFKTGSLVGVGTTTPLTVISEIREVYAYFSFSEVDFLRFSEEYAGATISEKIRSIPAVELVLADNKVYQHKGRIEILSGQFNATTGAISLRAKFPNESGLLRSGLTGKIRIPRQLKSVLAVPQEATFELQDKILVFVMGDNNSVSSLPIHVVDEYANFYLVQGGLELGQKVVLSGTGRLHEGAVILPEPVSADSLLSSNGFQITN